MSAFEISPQKPAEQSSKPSYPIHLSISESESLFELNQTINDKLMFVMKNTKEEPVMGSLEAYFKSLMTEEEILEEQRRAEDSKLRQAQI